MRHFLITVVITFLLWCGAGWFIKQCHITHKEWDQAIYNDGAEAYSVGVEATANPYVGRHTGHAEQWLHGWIDAKQRDR